MDILAHTLWAGAAVVVLSRRIPITTPTAVATLGLAALPDLLHLLPIIGWWIVGSGSFEVLRAYADALPGREPVMPALVTLLSHHLHCIGHSAVIAGGVTLLLWRLRGALWIPLLGWWLHIVIDVPTHSADFYPVPVLYPFTERGFDGIAWNTPWFMALNYVALGLVALWLLRSARPDGLPRWLRRAARAAEGSEPGR